MTAGLMGSGTEADPWLIETHSHLRTVVRDVQSSGYYRIVADLSSEGAALSYIDGYSLRYGAKVIDGDGHSIELRFVYRVAGTVDIHCVRNVHFRNAVIHLVSGGGSANELHFFDNCSMEDVAVYFGSFPGNSKYMSGFIVSSAAASLRPRIMNRVVIAPAQGVIAASVGPNNTYNQPPTEYCFALQSGTGALPAGFTRVSAQNQFTLEGLDALSHGALGAFAASGWVKDSSGLLMPGQVDNITFLVTTSVGGAPASRNICAIYNQALIELGVTDSNGYGEFKVRPFRRSGVTLLATEDAVADPLYSNMSIRAGANYLPPIDNGFVYRANSSGQLGDISGVLFGASPVTISGIMFEPVPNRLPAISSRYSSLRHGTMISVMLAEGAGGGGGPIIEGDPAYLDGVVEEIHPMTGQRQALGNCEVVAFERRGSDYVAMGSTYSDGIGGFRLETDVYGGGDVFAFAADFPGVIFQPGVPLNVGDRIRPALANGYVYEIIQPGTAGPAEPVWWPDEGGGTEGAIGTARARARPYYQPVGHGPLKMTLIE